MDSEARNILGRDLLDIKNEDKKPRLRIAVDGVSADGGSLVEVPFAEAL